MSKAKILALALAAALPLSLIAGCSGSDNSQGDNNTSQTEENAQGGNANTSDGTIPIGILAPLSGDVAEYGTMVRNGAMLYIDQINEAGGVAGKTIVTSEYDEEGDPEKAVTGYNSLVDQGVTAVIGDVTTGPTLAVVPEAHADNMPMITASATAAAVTHDEESGTTYSNVFRSCFIDPFQGEKMADFAHGELKASTAAILYCNGNDYSIGLKDAFEAKAKELGIDVVAVESFADNAVDFQSQLTNIASSNPDVLFVPHYYQTIALVAQQASQAGIKAAMLGGDGWDAVMGVVSDPALLEGAYYCSGYSDQDTSESVQNFLSAYREKYGSEPNMFAAQGYDAAAILLAAIEKAEGQELEAGTDEYKQAVIDSMKATDMDCVTGHVTYDELNNPNKEAFIINIAGGEAKFWGKY